MANRLLILAWHNVNATWCFPSGPDEGRRGLVRQMEWLRRAANVIDLRDGLTALSEGRSLPARAVALTFDDGYRDNLDDALPVLERLSLPATFFLAPGLISGDMSPWWERLGWAFERARTDHLLWDSRTYDLRRGSRWAASRDVGERLKLLDESGRQAAVSQLVEQLDPVGEVDIDKLMLDWDGARQLVKRGFAVGSHSMEHRILSRESAETQRADLATSKAELQDRLGVAVDMLAYPNGRAQDYAETTVAAARDVGYRFAVTTINGWNSPDTPPFSLRRFILYPERGAIGFGTVAGHSLRSLVRRSTGEDAAA
jgi:peptidoglycan/xylan/chitin deacetylase (PgdA/CDA1 family)